jgi:NitT/TauT family transport system substrate-binding protein
MRRAAWTAAVLAVSWALIAAACGPSTPAPSLPAQAESKPLAVPRTHLTIGYGAISGLYIPLWVAKEAGSFEKYGLEVELVHLPGNTGPQSLVSGQVPVVALSGFASVPSMVEGADLVMIAAMVQRLPAVVYGTPGVETPEALRGKRLGITRPGTLTHFAAMLALREWGFKPDQDVMLVNMNETDSILSGLLGGALDAGVLVEPTSFVAAKQGYPVLIDLAAYPREYIAAGFTTTTAYLQQQRPLLLSVLKAAAEGLKRFYEDKPFALEVTRQYARYDDPEVLERTYALYAERYFVKVPLPSVQGIQNILDDYAQVNPRAREVDAARLVDPSLVAALQREGFYRSLGLE